MKHVDLRQRLLRAAEQEIMVNGLARTSLRGIARRVGVSHQATAHHFDDRAGLFTALAIEGFETLGARTRAAIDSASEPGGHQVALAGAAYLQFATRHPTMFDVMFRPELVHVEDERLVEVRRTHLALLIDTMSAAQDAGWGPGIPVEELAALAWATVHGLAVLQRDTDLVGGFAGLGSPEDVLRRVAMALDALG